jgi:hypothetical protein
MKKLKTVLVVTLAILINTLLPYQSGYGMNSCTRTDYYNGCGELFWSTGDPFCQNVIVVLIETECDT